jgi:WD40 repeat protein
LNAEAERSRLAERSATDRLYEALVTRAEAGRTSGRIGQRFDSLEALRQAADIARAQGRPDAELVPLRNAAAACLALPDLRLEKEWDAGAPNLAGLGFDASFERYALVTADHVISVRRTADHQELFHFPTPPSNQASRWTYPRFSPDGAYLAIWYSVWADRRPVEVWKLDSGETRPRLTVADASCRPEFVPDGRLLAVEQGDHAGRWLGFYDLATGTEVRHHPLRCEAERIAFSPEGQVYAVSYQDPVGVSPVVHIRAVPTGKVIQELAHPQKVEGLAWSPDGRLLAAGCHDHRIHLWNTTTRGEEGVLEGHRWELHDLAFDRTGTLLASFGWEMTVRIWDVPVRRQLLSLDNVRSLGFRGDGRFQFTCLHSRMVQIWEFLASDVLRFLRGPGFTVHHVGFSTDDRWVATSTIDFHWLHEQQIVADLRAKGKTEAGGSGARATNRSVVAGGIPHGLVRWPLGLLSAEGLAGLRVGPRQAWPGRDEMLYGPGQNQQNGHRWCPCPDDPRRLYTLNEKPDCLRLIEAGEPRRVLWEEKFRHPSFVAISPDGHWLAAGSWEGGPGVRIWDTPTRQIIKDLPTGDANVAFSGDGRWLYTVTGRLSSRGAECRAWHVGTWEPGPAHTLDRPSSGLASLALAPDGTFLTVSATMSQVRLLTPDTLSQIVTLTSPEVELLVGQSLSPDGRLLAVAAGSNVQLWDLHRLRRDLRDLGLDWEDQPPAAAGDGGLNRTRSRQ